MVNWDYTWIALFVIILIIYPLCFVCIALFAFCFGTTQTRFQNRFPPRFVRRSTEYEQDIDAEVYRKGENQESVSV